MDTGRKPDRQARAGRRTDVVLWRWIPGQAGTLFTGDLDGDGDAELVGTWVGTDTHGRPGTAHTFALDQGFRRLWEYRSRNCTARLFCDVGGDGKAEVVLAAPGYWSADPADRLAPWVEVLDRTGQLRWAQEYEPPDKRLPPQEWSVHPLFAADVDGDGKVEVGAGAWTGGCGLRQLWLLREGAKEPHAKTALADARIALADLNGDGTQQVIFGGYAQCNHREGQAALGINDHVCRVLAFDHKLKLLWKTAPLSGFFTRASVIAAPNYWAWRCTSLSRWTG